MFKLFVFHFFCFYPQENKIIEFFILIYTETFTNLIIFNLFTIDIQRQIFTQVVSLNVNVGAFNELYQILNVSFVWWENFLWRILSANIKLSSQTNEWRGELHIQQGQNKTLIDRKNKPPKIIKNTKKQKEWESVSMYWKISEFESTELTNVLST